MGVSNKGYVQVGYRFPDLIPNLLISVPVGHVVRVGDVGDETLHWEGVGRIPQQGGLQADGEATPER